MIRQARTTFQRETWLAGGLLLLALIAGACGGSDESSPQIAIVNTLSSLDPIVNSFENAVQDSIPGAEFIELSPVAASLEEGVRMLLDEEPDLIVTLNTPNSLLVAGQAMAAGVPQVFGMVTDPLGSGLVSSLDEPGNGRTGVGLLHIQHTLELAVEATGATRVAILHNPADAASVSGVALAHQAAANLGVELVEMIADSDSDLDRVLRSGPPEGSEAFYLVGSPFAARNLGDITLVARTWDVPTFSALSLDTLPAGFLAGVAPDSSDLGRQMADRAIAILNGGEAGTIPVGVSANVSILDLDESRRRGLKIPDDVLIIFDRVLGADT